MTGQHLSPRILIWQTKWYDALLWDLVETSAIHDLNWIQGKKIVSVNSLYLADMKLKFSHYIPQSLLMRRRYMMFTVVQISIKKDDCISYANSLAGQNVRIRFPGLKVSLTCSGITWLNVNIRSWNNGVCCMSFYILTIVFWFVIEIGIPGEVRDQRYCIGPGTVGLAVNQAGWSSDYHWGNVWLQSYKPE